MKRLLADYYLASVMVPSSKLVLTTIGREQRDSGVAKLKEAILQDGFMDEFAPIATIMSPLREDQSVEDAIALDSFRLKVIDGNHRVKAVQMIDQEQGKETRILVRVHSVMGMKTMRMVASGKIV